MQSRATRISSIRNRNPMRENQYTPITSYPLTTSLLWTGSGSSVPSFSRATSATVVDHEGIIRTCKVGEARFQWARRVENLIRFSENLAHATWTKTSIDILSTWELWPYWQNNAMRVRVRNTNNGVYQSIPLTIGKTYTFSMWLKWTPWNLVRAVLNNGMNWYYSTATNPTGEWQRVSGTFTAVTPSTYIHLRADLPTSIPNFEFYFGGMQLEEWSVMSEYVSYDALSAPYHGAGVDGVKYFSTLLDGTPIADSILRGYLAEGTATNLLLNSSTLATQSVTVTAGIHTLSFYGTGTVVLSGAGTGTVIWWTKRKVFFFTATAGTLNLTVTGTVEYAQLETWEFETSWIPTTTASVTRNVDSLSFGNPINIFSSYTIQAEATLGNVYGVYKWIVGSNVAHSPLIQHVTSGSRIFAYNSTWSSSINITDTNIIKKIAFRKSDIIGLSVNGSAIASGALWTQVASNPTLLYVGNRSDGWPFYWCVKNLKIYKTAVSDNRLISLSS